MQIAATCGIDGVARLRVHPLLAQRADLARRVLPLEGREIHHPDREVERPDLRCLLDRPLLERRRPAPGRRPDRPASPGPASVPRLAGARVVRADELVGALAGGAVAGDGRRHGLRVYPALSSRRPGLAPGAVLRRGGQARLAPHEEVREPVAHLGEVLRAPERRSRTGQLVRLVGDAHEPHRPLERAQHAEQRLGLADRRAQVALAVLDEQRRVHVAGEASGEMS